MLLYVIEAFFYVSQTLFSKNKVFKTEAKISNAFQ